MNRLFALLVEYGSAILFILLQVISFYLIVNYNQSQKDIYFHSANQISGSILEKSTKWNNFLDLQNINDSIRQKNADLKEEIIALRGYGAEPLAPKDLPYELMPAQIINQSIHFRNNYITINKGSNHGLKKNLGVISDDGLVGIIQEVNADYSRCISLLNTDIRVTGSVKSKNYFGNLSWDGEDRSQLILKSIPRHANIAIGDTIETNGYSFIFPPNIGIGKINDFYVPKGDANFIINVQLFTDFGKLQHVYVLKENSIYNNKTAETEQ